MQTSEVMVSVYCAAYNHEKFIRDTLEGFVTQKTNFPFEVIVHDDASTDGTAQIIREYAEKYPTIIKPIYQTVNQYSQGINIVQTHIIPVVSGKYVAVCEGDDYWCDCNKLQKQLDFLESHPEYSACVHNTRKYNMNTGKETLFRTDGEQDLTIAHMIAHPGTSCHTSSFFYRVEYLRNRPAFVHSGCSVGDYPMTIYLTMEGKVRYFPDVMSFYRQFTKGSWTNRMLVDKNMAIRSQEQFVGMLKMADEYSEGRYHEAFERAIARREFRILQFKDQNLAAIRHPFFKEAGMKEKLKLYVKLCFPWVRWLKRNLIKWREKQ